MGAAEIVLPNGSVKQLGPEEPELDAPAWEDDRDVDFEAGLRRLAISGGRPYILITVDQDGVQLDHYGLPPETIVPGLRELADAIEAAA